MPYARALIQMHAATALFGVSAILGRLMASGPGVIVFGRTAFALLALSVLLLHARRTPWVTLSAKDVAGLMWIGGLLAAHWLTFFTAVKVGNVAVATLGFASFPAFVAILETALFRDPLTRGEQVLILLVTTGLVLVTPSFTLANEGTAGLLWGIASGLLYALIAIANRSVAGRISSVQASWWQYAATVLLVAPFAGPALPSVPPLDWAWLAVLGLLCTGLAYALFISSLSALKATTAAIVISLEPVYAIALAAILLGEAPTLRMIAGGVLIVGAVIQAGRWSDRASPLP